MLVLILGIAALLSSCGSSAQSRQPQPIKIDGSSTVYP
ncbi:MAG TPA: ABC transporter substrate-binding protein, partial [Cyanobacteria bacterium UBA8543]|nr:ABC transporter substrate-binding protein [Cyanobacteria bacterium UBA8543]